MEKGAGGCEAAQRLRVIQVLKRWMDWCPWEFSPSEAETVEEARVSTQLLTVTLLFSHYLLTQPGCTGDHAQALLTRCEAKGMMAQGRGQGSSILRSPSIDTTQTSLSSTPVRPLSGSYGEGEEERSPPYGPTTSLLSALTIQCGEKSQERVLRVRVCMFDLDILVDSIDPQVLGVIALDLLTGQEEEEDEGQDEGYPSSFRAGQVLWPEDFTGDGTSDPTQRHSLSACSSCKGYTAIKRNERLKEIGPCGHQLIHWAHRLLRPIKDNSSISLLLMKCRKRFSSVDLACALLLRLLALRILPDPEMQEERETQRIYLTAIEVLYCWIECRPKDMYQDPQLEPLLTAILGYLQRVCPGAVDRAQKALDLLGSTSTTASSPVSSAPALGNPFSRRPSLGYGPGTPEDFVQPLTSADPQILGIEFMEAERVARALCHRDARYFAAIPAREFLDGRWMRPGAAPALTAWAKRWNNLVWAMAGTILRNPQAQDRAMTLGHILRIAEACADPEIRDYDAAFALVSACRLGCVERLNRTWALLGSDDMARYGRLCRLVDATENYPAYRQVLAGEAATAGPTHSATFLIPHLRLVQVDLLHAQEGNRSAWAQSPAGEWELAWGKWRLLGKILGDLRLWQDSCGRILDEQRSSRAACSADGEGMGEGDSWLDTWLSQQTAQLDEDRLWEWSYHHEPSASSSSSSSISSTMTSPSNSPSSPFPTTPSLVMAGAPSPMSSAPFLGFSPIASSSFASVLSSEPPSLSYPSPADLSVDYLTLKPSYFPDDNLTVAVRYTAEEDWLPPGMVHARLDDAFGSGTLVPDMGSARLPHVLEEGVLYTVVEWIVPHNLFAHYTLDQQFRLVLSYKQQSASGDAEKEEVTDREITLQRVQAVPGGPSRHPLYPDQGVGGEGVSFVPAAGQEGGGSGRTGRQGGDLSAVRVAEEGAGWASHLFHILLRHFVF
ncbi:ras guanine nucleotide exchange factor domain-containing protein [Piptocephalis cylindrospora]|uniref:Ras guanine nucleotide exchange factor domain-containing protein n=1 Tax=Piptocephalis cylindrospora TaxID=1907219 RepID=A0A4P9Y4L3_9FUNG|nr:ras guanine nucleotide exchange factor domain-containing protein [Piptocephalis cylindrospora]|eukprot:RKP13091.1 ras guanine nucleotide exchange factor domain-containing protein [Piptocephalis cylindrospora]